MPRWTKQSRATYPRRSHAKQSSRKWCSRRLDLRLGRRNWPLTFAEAGRRWTSLSSLLAPAPASAYGGWGRRSRGWKADWGRAGRGRKGEQTLGEVAWSVAFWGMGMETRRTRRWDAEERADTSARGKAWGLAGSDWSNQCGLGSSTCRAFLVGCTIFYPLFFCDVVFTICEQCGLG